MWYIKNIDEMNIIVCIIIIKIKRKRKDIELIILYL